MAESKNKSRKKDQELDALAGVASSIGMGFVNMLRHPMQIVIFLLAAYGSVWLLKNYETAAMAMNLTAEQMYYGRYIGLLVPIFLLWMYGSMDDSMKTMAEKFESIKFTNKVGQHPKVRRTYRDRKDRRIKIIEFYSPGIPLLEWNRRKDDIESALDCTILQMKRDADTKQTIIAKTVSSQYKIPAKIDWEDRYIPDEDFVVTVGEGLLGPITVDLNRLPHAIVAGTTGSGKSVTLRCLLWQAIKKGAKIYIVDFKGGVEFDRRWEDFAEVVTDQMPALELLTQLVAEMKARLTLFRQTGVKNISAYNQKVPNDPLCHIVLGCDELAELLDKEGITDKDEKKLIAEIDRCITSLARLARAAGIHMLLGMQRPDAKVLKGQIKNNAPIRICGRAEPVLSEIVLGTPKAGEISDDELGRFYCNIGGLQEFQGYWFTDELLADGNYQIGRMLTEGTEPATEERTWIDESDYKEFEVSTEEQKEWEEEMDLELEGITV